MWYFSGPRGSWMLCCLDLEKKRSARALAARGRQFVASFIATDGRLQ